MSIPAIVKYRCLAIAKGLAPVDSGNLRHNAIYLTRVKNNSFSIMYDGNRAHYLNAVNEGIGQPAQHFVDNAVGEIGTNLLGYFNKGEKGFKEGSSQFNAYAKRMQSESLRTAQDNPERQWRLTQSLLKSKGANYRWR